MFAELKDVSCGSYIYIYYWWIHHWWILWSSYRKLVWVGFEPTTTEFRSDALTDWAIRPWVQLALRANFVQLLQLHIYWIFFSYFTYILDLCIATPASYWETSTLHNSTLSSNSSTTSIFVPETYWHLWTERRIIYFKWINCNW